MDNALTSGRRFPAYTLAELERALLKGNHDEKTMTALTAEIEARKAGQSAALVVPQNKRMEVKFYRGGDDGRLHPVYGEAED